MTAKHTVSKAGLIYAGNVAIPGHQEGIIGAPLGNALCRFVFDDVNSGAVVATLNASSAVGSRISVMQDVAYTERDYTTTKLGPVLNIACAGNETSKTATFRGMDGAGQFATKVVALVNATSVETPIGWSRIDSIELSATLANTVTITAADKFSLPFAVVAADGQLQSVYVDGTVVASPSYTLARAGADTATGADGRGLLDLSGETLSDSSVVINMFIHRKTADDTIGITTYTDAPTYNFVR